MRKFLLLGFTLFHLVTVAQTGTPSVKQVEKEIDSYLQAAEDSLMTNLPFATRAAQRAIDLAKSHGLIRSELRCYLTLTSFYRQYEKYDLVVRNYDRAIALGLPESEKLHYAKLPYLEKINDADKAIQDAANIAEIARSKSNRQERINALIVLGNLHGKRGDYEKSLEYLGQAERLAGKDNPKQQAYVQGYIGDNYYQMKENGKAETHYRNSMDMGSQVKDTSLMVANFDRLNDVYRQQNRGSDLIALNNNVVKRGSSPTSERNVTAHDAEDLLTKDKSDFWVPAVQSRASLNLAEAHLDLNANDEAIQVLEEMKEKTPAQDLDQSSEVHKLLSRAYDQSGKYAQALDEYKTYVAIQDSLLKQKDIKIAEALERNLELQDLENQVVFLEKDKELDAQAIALHKSDLRRQQTLLFAALGMALVILCSLIIVIRKNRAKTVANNLLELKSLRTKMNPHFIFNSLNSVNHFIAQNDEKAANKYLSQFSKLMRDVLDSSDKDFIPLEKEIELLKVYLALEHQRFESKFDYQLTIDPDIDTGDYRIPPMLVQPFIENAIWHGLRYIKYPGALAVRFFQRQDHLMIEIQDNGIGRAASQALKTSNQSRHQSSGIDNSRNRIDIINKVYGAAISINIIDQTGEQTGTLVQISIQGKHGN